MEEDLLECTAAAAAAEDLHVSFGAVSLWDQSPANSSSPALSIALILPSYLV